MHCVSNIMILLQDECSYVSLRDVERCMIVFEWFHCLHKDIYKEMVRVGGMEEVRPCICNEDVA